MTQEDVSARIGAKLLEGWTMLADTCKGCNSVPLMRDKQGKQHCLLCGEAPANASPSSDEFITINEKSQHKTKSDGGDDEKEKKKTEKKKQKHKKKADKQKKQEEKQNGNAEEKTSPKSKGCCQHHQKACHVEIDPQSKSPMKRPSQRALFTVPLEVIKSLVINILKLDLDVQSPSLLLTTLDILDEQLSTFELLKETHETHLSSEDSENKHADDIPLDHVTSAADISTVATILYGELRRKLESPFNLAATMKVSDLDSAALQRSLFEVLILLSHTLSQA